MFDTSGPAREKTNVESEKKRTENETDRRVAGQVLVADDDPIICKLVEHALEAIGFDVHTVQDGQRAYDRFMTGRWALVITDFQMPGMDGLTLIRKIKAASPHTPVILISGTVFDTLPEINGREAVSAFLKKPFPMTEIHRTALAALR